MKRIVLLTLFAATPVLAEVSADRGEYLVRGPMGCGNCHTPMGPDGPVEGMEFAGTLLEETPDYTVITANITPGGSVANWSDEELGKAIREGVRPDGSVIGPPMPFEVYHRISDDDLASIVTFLRTVPAVDNDPGKSVYNFPLPPAWGPPLNNVSAPEPGVSVEWGEYIVALAHCMACHSTPDETGAPDLENHLGQGGMEFHLPMGSFTAPNITSSEDGIAGYSDDELKAIITTGMRPDGEAMTPPMPYWAYARMTPEDLDAVVLYLRSVPPRPDPS